MALRLQGNLIESHENIALQVKFKQLIFIQIKVEMEIVTHKKNQLFVVSVVVSFSVEFICRERFPFNILECEFSCDDLNDD